MNMKRNVITAFREKFGEAPQHIVRAPGRVNLIGEHTDYNLGFSLPMAIDQSIWIALRPRQDRSIRLRSAEFSEEVNLQIDDISHGAGWTDYVHGVTWALKESGYPLSGWEGVLISDIPVASGLSSSAALELAIARAFWVLTRWDWDGVRVAEAAQMHENQWLGLKSGILDQMISAIGQAGQAFLLDFMDLSHRAVPLPADVSVLVVNTMVKRGLVDSAYNERVAQCRQAADFFGVSSLREVSLEQLLVHENKLDPLIFRRACHVVSENQRTEQAAAYLQVGETERFGELMNASHASLRDDYEVSCHELDLIVESADQQPGCYGARMTGAGFGGCAIALVDSGAAKEVAREVVKQYEKETGITPETYLCRPANGAEVIK